MPSRASLRLQSKIAASDDATRPDAPSGTDLQPSAPPPKAASRRKRVALKRSETVADHSESFEDEIRVGTKRPAVEPEALADLTFPPQSSPAAKKPRRGRPRKLVRSNDESLVILIEDKPPAGNPTAAQAARAGKRRRTRSAKDTDEGAGAAQRDSPEPGNPVPQPASSKEDSNTTKRRNSLQRPTPRVLRLPGTVEVDGYDVPDDDEEEEVSAVKENDDISFALSGRHARGYGGNQDHNGENGGQGQKPDDNEVQERYEEQDPDDLLEEEAAAEVGRASASVSDEAPALEAIELPFGPEDAQDHHYVKVYCGSLQTAFLQMGKEYWAGGGEGWHSSWKLSGAFDSTKKLAVALKELYIQLGQAPMHPEVAKQDEYLRKNAKRLELRITAINTMATDFCGSFPQHRDARALAEDVIKSIVPAGIVLLRQVFLMGGMSTELSLSSRRCAYMSPTTVSIAKHIIGWLKALTNTIVRRVIPASDASMKDIRAQISREALLDYLEQIQKGRGGLADSEAKFEEIAEAERVEQECQEAEAAVRREAASHDATIKQNRQMEAQARYATNDDQYMAFCRSTQNLGPDPLWEHRRRKMQASMRAFGVADVGYGVSRQPLAVTKAPKTEVQKPATQLDARQHVMGELHGEPSEEEKKVILEHVVKNPRFNVDAVANELGWAPGHVRRWRDILVDRARKAYQARGYSVSRLPEWLA
ncbi:hypothetical protein MGG_04322 [Pyricularia oryzae 70-15]|uniref:Uncharacterized protein n=3 Tax=Pyricularia oryzae TaxID=318829 RepID=G4NGG2_PYRO7|nr:uncharacterized protein MGG_04322 [Pyricularia oryzae 70-15]EHA47119.1 hypothetical protein MGG_04322 [Pyricularia oryzae 70-15]ELQ41228.1 hypothetical protein OOU_Y34scaffold00290g25 [Pyricularia oryzae Y34]KAI7922559.1 hypothetical protein M0657_005551 [Pyricularia oryzae]KAI7922770.1 hypothetical protein M9X92_004741 [Pyricularia oryzae]